MEEKIYVLAHEVKNPLAVAKGYVEMLNEDNVFKYKEIINEEIKQSIQILDSYMSYDKLTINKEEVDLNVLLSDVYNSYNDYLKKKNIKLNIRYIDDEIYIKLDYNKIKEVLYNIIKNSIESSSSNIDIYYVVNKSNIIIYIQNDGLKINDDDISKIGNNFSNKVLGNGIGMTLSKKIIKLHKGSIITQNNDLGVITTINLRIK